MPKTAESGRRGSLRSLFAWQSRDPLAGRESSIQIEDCEFLHFPFKSGEAFAPGLGGYALVPVQIGARTISADGAGPTQGLHSIRRSRERQTKKQRPPRSANRGACAANRVRDRALRLRRCGLRDCVCFRSSVLHCRSAAARVQVMARLAIEKRNGGWHIMSESCPR